MQRIILLFILSFCTGILFAQDYVPVDNGSTVKFTIKNFGVNTSGTFTGLRGTIKFDPGYPEQAFFNVSVDAGTVNTNIGARDNHLRKETYFNVQKYPRISFVSTKVGNTTKAGILYITGNITIKGISKEISFPFTATEEHDGYLFAGEFKINRIDFKVGGNSLVLSGDLIVSLSVLTKKIN